MAAHQHTVKFVNQKSCIYVWAAAGTKYIRICIIIPYNGEQKYYKYNEQ